MPGGRRPNSGRKLKWGEKLMKISVPSSVGNVLSGRLEHLLIEKRIPGEDIIRALDSIENRRLKKYDMPVAAGMGSTANIGGHSMDAFSEEIDLYSLLVDKPEKTILIPVVGNSMIGIGIWPGDFLLVEQIDPLFERPSNGDVVIVSVDDEVMVKRYRLQDGDVFLDSENPDYEPIPASEREIYITGIVRNSIRMNLSKS